MRHKREGSQCRFINDQVTALGNWGSTPWGTSGRRCEMRLRAVLPQRQGRWGICPPASTIFGGALLLRGTNSSEPLPSILQQHKGSKGLSLKVFGL